MTEDRRAGREVQESGEDIMQSADSQGSGSDNRSKAAALQPHGHSAMGISGDRNRRREGPPAEDTGDQSARQIAKRSGGLPEAEGG